MSALLSWLLQEQPKETKRSPQLRMTMEMGVRTVMSSVGLLVQHAEKLTRIQNRTCAVMDRALKTT